MEKLGFWNFAWIQAFWQRSDKNKILCFFRAILTFVIVTGRLRLSAIHIEIQVARCLDFTKISGIRVNHINEICICSIQFLTWRICCKKWQSRIQTCVTLRVSDRLSICYVIMWFVPVIRCNFLPFVLYIRLLTKLTKCAPKLKPMACISSAWNVDACFFSSFISRSAVHLAANFVFIAAAG